MDEAYFTYSAEEQSALGEGGNADNSVSPLAEELSKYKTVTKYYANFDSVPEFYSYSEYSEGYWWSGA